MNLHKKGSIGNIRSLLLPPSPFDTKAFTVFLLPLFRPYKCNLFTLRRKAKKEKKEKKNPFSGMQSRGDCKARKVYIYIPPLKLTSELGRAAWMECCIPSRRKKRNDAVAAATSSSSSLRVCNLALPTAMLLSGGRDLFGRRRPFISTKKLEDKLF